MDANEGWGFWNCETRGIRERLLALWGVVGEVEVGIGIERVRHGHFDSKASGLLVDRSPMSDFKCENDEALVLNDADDPIVANAIPPHPGQIA